MTDTFGGDSPGWMRVANWMLMSVLQVSCPIHQLQERHV